MEWNNRVEREWISKTYMQLQLSCVTGAAYGVS